MRFHAPRPHFKIYRRYANAECRHIERKRNIPRPKRESTYFAEIHPPGSLPRLRLAKTVELPCHRERKRGDPLE